jgi:hypothetical protein
MWNPSMSEIDVKPENLNRRRPALYNDQITDQPPLLLAIFE